MTRAVPIHRVVGSGLFSLRAWLRAINSAWSMYVQAVPLRKKEIPQGLKPSLEPVRCGTAKAVPFVQPDAIKERITGAQEAPRGFPMRLRIETPHYSRRWYTRNRSPAAAQAACSGSTSLPACLAAVERGPWRRLRPRPEWSSVCWNSTAGTCRDTSTQAKADPLVWEPRSPASR